MTEEQMKSSTETVEPGTVSLQTMASNLSPEVESITDLKSFYEFLKNPINDDATLLSIIEAYSISSVGIGGLYTSLQNIGTEDKETRKSNSVEAQKFEEGMYGRWRKSVVGMTEQNFKDSERKGSLGKDFLDIRNFVIAHPECKSNRELKDAIGRIPDKDLMKKMLKAARDNGWDLDDGWRHIKSRYVKARQEERIVADHRFYLNTDSSFTHATAMELVEMYEKNGLPYYFKFDEGGARADTIVIYTSTKDLIKNLDILKQLKKERPELAEHFHTPPVLTGRIDGDIGYGAEPEGGGTSYSEVRSGIIDKVLERTTLNWVDKHKNDIIRHDGQEMTLSAYIVSKEVEFMRERLVNRYKLQIQDQLDRQRIENTKTKRNDPLNMVVAHSNAERILGFNLRDLESQSEMFKVIQRKLTANFDTNLQSLRNGRFMDLRVSKKNSSTVQLGEALGIVITQMTPKIVSHYPSFLKEIRDEISKGLIAKGIDAKKFVFDKSTILKMKKQSHEDRARQRGLN